MNFEKFKKISQSNEVRIDNHKGHKRTPPFYYDSLRNAFSSYFKTFHTQNSTYDFYAQGIGVEDISILSNQLLDEDNTVLTIIAFERFCELFLKDLLKKINVKLTYQAHDRNKNIETIISRISEKRFRARKVGQKSYTIPFLETIQRFYDLIEIAKSERIDNVIIKKFKRLIKKYQFLELENSKTVFRILNWYRDRILHNGNSLPSLWLLDYFITQELLPVIYEIITIEKKKLGNSLFYLSTPSKINVLEELIKINYEFEDLKTLDKQQDIFIKLLKIGHLKELGRASLNINIFERKNIQAGYEYNYKKPIDRGKRFAEAEKVHKNFKDIAVCPCCGEKSMVIYQEIIDDIFSHPLKKKIEWVKCYTCDYHIRYNVGDPLFFKLHNERIFEK